MIAYCVVGVLSMLMQTTEPASTLCSTPQRAARTFLDNLKSQQLDLDKAATCAQQPDGLDRAMLGLRMRDLKRVFDANGYYINVERLPDRSDYTDPDTGLSEVALHRALAEVVLVRDDVGWRFPLRVVEHVPTLVTDTFFFDFGNIINRLPDWMRSPVLGLMGWQILVLALLVALGLLVRTVVAWSVAGWARRVMHGMRITWGYEVLGIASQPLGTLALAGVLALGLPAARLSVGLAAICLIAVRLLAALAAVMVLYRIVDLFCSYLDARAQQTDTKLDDQLVPMVRKGLKVVVVALGVVFVLQNLDVDVGSLLAGLGLGGLAFALAAKDTVANLFGSVTIFLDKPFQIGDWVVMSGVEGVVEEVGFRSTRVRTFYNSLVSVPNSKIVDAAVDNYGLRRYRRTFAKLSINYASSPEQIEAFCAGIRAILRAHERTRKDYYEIHFTGFGDSGLEIMLYFFFEVPSWSDELRARHEVYLDILRLATRLGIEFAFPTRTLHIESQVPPQAAPDKKFLSKDDLEKSIMEFGPGGSAVVSSGSRVSHGWFVGVGDEQNGD